MKLQNIKDVDGYKKDLESNGILSIDNNALASYKKMRNQQLNVLQDINNIKGELEEIRDMLYFLLSSKKDS